MTEPARMSVELSVAAPTGVDIPQMLDVRRKAREDAEWYSTLNPASTATVSPTEGGLAANADALKGAQTAAKPQPKAGGEGEADALGEPMVRKGVDESFRVLFGFSLDDVQRAVETGTLPDLLGQKAREGATQGVKAAEEKFGEGTTGADRTVGAVVGGLLGGLGHVFDQGGRLMEPVARDAAVKSGTPSELVEQVVGMTGMLAGILFPPGGGAGKAGKAGKAAEGAAGAAKGAKGAKAAAKAEAQAAEKAAAEAEGRMEQLRKILLRDERGSIQVGPSGGGKAPEPEGELRLNLDRINVEDSVKSIMAQVNREAERRLAQHRQVQSNAATIEQAKRVFPTFEDAHAASLEELILDKAKELRHRDYFAALGRVVEDLVRRGRAGDVVARAQFEDAWAIFERTADKDELVAAFHARAQQSRQILSDPSRVSMPPHLAARQTQRVAETIKAEARALEDLTAELATAKQTTGVAGLEKKLEQAQARADKLREQIADAKEQGKAAEAAQKNLAETKKEVERLSGLVGVRESIDLYRGVPAGKDPRSTEGTVGGLFYSDTESVAQNYANGGTMLKERVSFKRLLKTANWLEAKDRLGLPRSATMQELVKAAESAGFDGLSFTTTNGREVIRLNPGPGVEKAERDLQRAYATTDKLQQQVADAQEAEKAAQRAAIDLKAEQDTAAALKDELKQIRERSPDLARLEASVQHVQGKIEELTLALEDAKLTERAALNMAHDRGLDVKTLAELRRELRGISDVDTIMARVEALPRKKRPGFAAAMWRYAKAGNDAMHWLFLQWVLSGPPSHVANVAGSAAMQAWHIPERYLAEWLSIAMRTGPEGVQRGETAAMLRAADKGLVTGWRWFSKALQSGEQPLGKTGKIEAHFDLAAQKLGLDPMTPLGKLAEVAGMMTPTRWMMSEDAFFKGFAHTSEMAALALRQALAEGKAGEELARRVKILEAAPTQEMLRQAAEAANLRTLNAPLGKAGQAAMKLRGAVPAGWMIAPFVQTPINSYKWFHRRAPGLSLLSVQNWSDIMAGGAARDTAVSRMLLGSAMAGAVVALVQSGKITGGMAAGSNKNLKRDLRELGPQPYSFRVGDEYIYYKRTDPLSQYVGAIATAMELHSQLSADDPDNLDWWDFAVAASLAGSRVALDTPWLQTFSRMIDALEAPDENGKKFLLNLVARPLVPAGVRELSKGGIGPEAIGLPAGTFPNLVEPRPEIRELSDFVDYLASGTFAFADKIPPTLHPITGDVLIRPPGWGPDVISPFYVTRRKDDPVLMEVVTHRMNFREPSKLFTGSGDPDRLNLDTTMTPDGVKLDRHQYYRLKFLATREVRDGRGRVMWEAMRDEVASPGYQRASPGPDGGKEIRLKNIYHGFYERARKRLRDEDPALRARFNEQKRNRLERQRPQSSAPATNDLASVMTALSQTLGG